MTDRQLRNYIAIVEFGSFSKAGEASFVTKQAMLQQINALEQEVGAVLLRRGRDGVHPTPAGEEFYRRSLELLQLQEDMLRACREISAPGGAGMAKRTSAPETGEGYRFPCCRCRWNGRWSGAGCRSACGAEGEGAEVQK